MNKTFVPLLLLLGSMVSIQSGASLAKQLFPMIGPDGTTFLRQTFASMMLWMVFKPWKHKFKKNELKFIFLYGIALGIMNLTFYMSIARIPLGIAVAIEFVGPLTVALWGSRKPLDFLWAVLATIGILLILPLTEISAPLDITGALLALAAGVCWGLYIIFGKKAGGNVHGGVATAVGMTVAAVVASPFGVVHGTLVLKDSKIFLIALGVALFSGALPYSLEMAALKRLPSHTFGILMSLEPALAALAGLIFLSEHLTIIQYLAIVCVIGASLGSALTLKPERTTPPVIPN